MTDRDAVTQEDIEAAEEIGGAMASYYEFGIREKYDHAQQAAARHRQATRAKVVEEICAAAFSLAATHYDNGNEGDSEVLSEFACYVRDQFTPPQTKD